MKAKGIRIQDLTESGYVAVELPDILKEVQNGDSFHWSILCLEASGNLGEGKSIVEFENEISDSKNGLFISWDDLNILSKKFHQIIDMVLIGCKNEISLQRYKTDQEMYEACDIVIDMFDSSYWKIFSKDEKFIDRLAAKFKDVEPLTPDFKK